MLSNLCRARLGSLAFGTCQSPAAATFDVVRRLFVVPLDEVQGTNICSTSGNHNSGYSQHSGGCNSSLRTAGHLSREVLFGSKSFRAHAAATRASCGRLSPFSQPEELPTPPGVPLGAHRAFARLYRALQTTWWSMVALSPHMVFGGWVGGSGDAGSSICSSSSSYGGNGGWGPLLLARRLPTEPEPFEDEYDDDEYEDGEFVDLDDEDLLGDVGEFEDDWEEADDDRDSMYDEDDAGGDGPEELGESEASGEGGEELPPPPPPPPRSRSGAWR